MNAAAAQNLKEALARRAALTSTPDTDAYRLLHQAADGFPGLTVDRFADVLVANLYDAQTLSAGQTQFLKELPAAVNARAVYVKYRPRQASGLSDAERAALAPAAPFAGEAVPEVVVREHGRRFLIRPGAGLSVGLFLDMRETRSWVNAHAAGRTVLNCFAYTCGFGVAAAAGGAARVVNLDLARPALDWGRENYRLNGLDSADQDFIFGDALDWLARFARRGQTFDIVLLDPPSYATSKKRRFSAARDYAELAARALPVTAPGGWLIACANAAELPEAAFIKQLRAGLASAEGRPARLTRTAHEPAPDFAPAPGDSPYLKIAFIHRAV